MPSRIKKTWTTREWIRFGNRVKRVRAELQSMIMEVQYVCRVQQLDGLLRVERQLDKWKSRMESVAARDVPGVIVTRIFYGDPLPEDAFEPDETTDQDLEVNEEQNNGR